MSVKIQNFQKPAPSEANGKPASGKATSEPAGNMGFFARLLHSLKSQTGEGKHAHNITAFHNRPLASKIDNTHHLHGPLKNNRSGSPHPTQNVNNLAASTLISLSAMTSGANRIGSFYSRGSGIVGHGTAPSSSRPTGTEALHSNPNGTQGIGNLSAYFESGEKGSDAIGFDNKGGTSYGTFQISSKAGTMQQFVDYLSEHAPAWAQQLKAAGPANTGGRSGRMPDTWRKITAQDPVGFSKMQYDFIEKTHYTPAVEEIAERTGVNIAQYPKAIQEVLWSTAVQHGPNGAARIFGKAIGHSQTKNGGIQMAQLIKSVYSMRAGQFDSSSSDVKTSVQDRFSQEGKIALTMLSDPFQQPDGFRV
jgi:hypothetical protein